jgi:hypothetical protein
MRGTSSSQFIEWCRFFELEMNERKPEHYYLAQVAAELRRPNVKEPRDVKTEHFLLTFVPEHSPKKKLTEKDKKARSEASKAFWLTLAGLSKEKASGKRDRTGGPPRPSPRRRKPVQEDDRRRGQGGKLRPVEDRERR